jgi:hypothetical protein
MRGGSGRCPGNRGARGRRARGSDGIGRTFRDRGGGRAADRGLEAAAAPSPGATVAGDAGEAAVSREKECTRAVGGTGGGEHRRIRRGSRSRSPSATSRTRVEAFGRGAPGLGSRPSPVERNAATSGLAAGPTQWPCRSAPERGKPAGIAESPGSSTRSQFALRQAARAQGEARGERQAEQLTASRYPKVQGCRLQTRPIRAM